MMGGHQGARSLHFIGMVLMAGFIVVHVTLVFLVHRERNVVHMAFGGAQVEVSNARVAQERSEEHTSELQSLMRISYAVFCLQNKKTTTKLHDKLYQH